MQGIGDTARLPVIFTKGKAKVDAFKQVKAVISYGDSDGDIRDSITGGARPSA